LALLKVTRQHPATGGLKLDGKNLFEFEVPAS